MEARDIKERDYLDRLITETEAAQFSIRKTKYERLKIAPSKTLGESVFA